MKTIVIIPALDPKDKMIILVKKNDDKSKKIIQY